MLRHADRRLLLLTHPEAHIGVRWSGSRHCIGNAVSRGDWCAEDFSPTDIDVFAPNFVLVPGDFMFSHPERIDFRLMLRAFICVSILFTVRAAHHECAALNRQHVDDDFGVIDHFCVWLHFRFGGSYGIRYDGSVVVDGDQLLPRQQYAQDNGYT